MNNNANQVTLDNVLTAIGDVPAVFMDNPAMVDVVLIFVAVVGAVGLLNAFALFLSNKL